MSADAGSGAGALELDVARAVAGDREALESVIAAIQPDVHRIALRFLWHPEDAEDATQEILIRVMTRLETFRGESAFRTWVFRVASNRLLTIRAKRAERQAMSFEEFAADLESGLSEDVVTIPDIEQDLLLDEVRIGCTMAMLLCLERPYRLAYILGEIMELDHNEGAAVMDISPAAFRARVSRARRSITALMTSRCGLVDASNPCRCRKRVATAIRLGRVDPHNLLFASSLARSVAFPQVVRHIRTLQEGRRAAALYRVQPEVTGTDFTSWLRAWLHDHADG
jgi:RNA polymerase sigma factor (sigma-70 family)